MAKMMSLNKIIRACRFDAFIICYPPVFGEDRSNFGQTVANIEPNVQHITGFIQ
jgi:hypothetical protein